MFCRQCGSEILDNNAIKCPSCGTKTNKGKRFCPHCGKPNPHGDNVCAYCGGAINEDIVKLAQEQQKQNSNPVESQNTNFQENDKVQVQPIKNNYPKTRDSEDAIDDTINPLAKKIMQQKGVEKAIVSYGKKPNENPLKVESQKTSQFEGIKRFSPNTKPFTPSDTQSVPVQQPVKNNNDSTFTPTSPQPIETKQNDFEDESKTSNKVTVSLSLFYILSIVFSVATLMTCQIIYAVAGVAFGLIELIKNKQSNALVVSVISVILTVCAIYFGISFYII